MRLFKISLQQALAVYIRYYSLKNVLIFVSECFPCMYVSCAGGGQKVSDPKEVVLQAAVSHHAGAEKQTPVLC